MLGTKVASQQFANAGAQEDVHLKRVGMKTLVIVFSLQFLLRFKMMFNRQRNDRQRIDAIDSNSIETKKNNKHLRTTVPLVLENFEVYLFRLIIRTRLKPYETGFVILIKLQLLTIFVQQFYHFFISALFG